MRTATRQSSREEDNRNIFFAAKKMLAGGIRGYKKAISPFIIKSCRFYPTCSEYAADAVETFGIFRGTTLALWRILRCNPFSRGGYDPVNKE